MKNLVEYCKLLPDGRHEIYDTEGRVIAIVEVKNGEMVHMDRADS